MCPPGCLDAVPGRPARGAKGGLAAAAVTASGAALSSDPTVAVSARGFGDVPDPTHPLYEGFPTSNSPKWFGIEPVFTYAKGRLNLDHRTLMEHTGTHVDAPLYLSADGTSVDQSPMADLVGWCRRR